MSSTRSDEMLRDEGLNVISQALYKEIYSELPNKIRDHRRWIWELMQNAKDVISGEGFIEVDLIDGEVTFAHNGSAFTYNNLAAILSQRTSKAPDYTDDQKRSFYERIVAGDEELEAEELKRFLKTSGRFGSGFMTTYLLSKEIALESIYTDGNRTKEFCLSLDRSVELEKDLIKKVKLSFDAFSEIEKFNETDVLITAGSDPNLCRTKFRYLLQDDGSRNIAGEGIADLHASIQYVFCFIEIFKQITVNEYGIKTIYRKIEPILQNQVEIVRVIKEVAGKEPEVIKMAKVAARHNCVAITMPVVKTEHSYKFIFPKEQTPFQFISFPLIGSEKFSFPVIVNSPLFNPGDAREKVYLNLTTDAAYNKKVDMNRQLLQKCVKLYDTLISHAIAEKWQNIHYLAKTTIPENTDVIWYKANIQTPILNIIINSPMVRTSAGKDNILVRNAKFPVYRNEKLGSFWKLSNYLIGSQIPHEDDAEHWKEIITNNAGNWGDSKFEFGHEDLLQLIADQTDITEFANHYFKDDFTTCYVALNEIILFTEEENKDLLDRAENPYCIIPSQAGPFTEKRKLSRDKGWPDNLIPRQLKDVLVTMGNNWYEKLVDDNISCFISERKRTVKEASDLVKAKTEKYLLRPVFKESELEEVKNFENYNEAMFELISISSVDSVVHTALFTFVKALFPGVSKTKIELIENASEFDWSYCHRWIISCCMEKVAAFGCMDSLSQLLFTSTYPTGIKLTDAESDLKFKADTFLNDLIAFAANFNHNSDHLLENFAVIPNQNNEFLYYSTDLFNDTYKKSLTINVPNDARPIPSRLKSIVFDLGEDVKKYLLHEGITLKLPDARDTEFVCGVADRLIIDNRDTTRPEIKDAIRELDKWIALNIEEQNRALYFGRFYEKRHSIVLNTYTPEERNHVDQILKSGKSEALAKISENVSSAETIAKLAEFVNNNDIAEVMTVMEKFPDMTVQRMEHLLRLEEISKGLKTEVEYTPDEVQKARNFITGYKGEAFIYKRLRNQGIDVSWTNLSLLPQAMSITDEDGELHYILDRGLEYDLTATLPDSKVVYIQVKATTTDITLADVIDLPISTREWNFIGETGQDESFYLARVFKVGNGPQEYYLKLDNSLTSGPL